MQSTMLIIKATLALTVCTSAWVMAAETSSAEISLKISSNDMTPEMANMVSEVPVTQKFPTVVSGFGVPVAISQLEEYRGGFDTVTNDMKLSGSVANNSAIQVTTGSNYIGGGSFANSSGLPMVIQNSGANVLIQNATIINVQYQQ